MQQIISGLLVLIWFLCWITGVRSVHIHVLLVLAATLFATHLAASLNKNKLQFTRPRRVSVQTPIRFRRAGDADWLKGMTENISQTGVLFQAERVYRLNTPVEMTLDVPQPILGLLGSIKCQGCIVRAVVSTFGDNAHLAAKITASESTRPE